MPLQTEPSIDLLEQLARPGHKIVIGLQFETCLYILLMTEVNKYCFTDKHNVKQRKNSPIQSLVVAKCTYFNNFKLINKFCLEFVFRSACVCIEHSCDCVKPFIFLFVIMTKNICSFFQMCLEYEEKVIQ